MTPAIHQPLKETAVPLGLLAVLMVVAILSGPRQILSQPKVWIADQLALAVTGLDELPGTDEFAAAEVQSVGEIGWLPQTTWVYAEVDLMGSAPGSPPNALYLSGPWSAEIYWDGELMGRKGQPADNLADEIPGPIDAVLFLPERSVAPGIHQLAMRVSTHHLGYRAETIFHSLSVGLYRDDARRDLRYYGLPLLFSGGFLILLIHFVRVGVESREKTVTTGDETHRAAAWLLALLALTVLGQLVLEVARSLVAYRYDWHRWRSFGIFVFGTVSGATLLMIALQSVRAGNARFWVAIFLLLAIAVGWLESGFDNKTVRAIQLSAAGVLLIHACSWRTIDAAAAANIAVAVCWLIGSMLDPVKMLDSTFFVSAIGYLSFRGWQKLQGDAAPAAKSAERSSIIVKCAGRLRRVKASDVVAVRADGNYSQLLMTNGEEIFHHQRLGEIMQRPPGSWSRVHKSYAINLDRLLALRSQSGSRYLAELSGGTQVPVSRYRVAELRKRMADSGAVQSS